MKSYYYCPKLPVWGWKAPPVCTVHWDQAAWDRYTDGYKPKRYTGGRYDEMAWVRYRNQIHLEIIWSELEKGWKLGSDSQLENFAFNIQISRVNKALELLDQLL